MTTRRGMHIYMYSKGNLLQGVAFLLLLVFTSSVPSIGYCEGTIDALKEYEYWADGKIRGCKVYDTDGRLRTKSFCRPDGTVEKIERYNTAGKKVQEGHFNPKGNLTAGLDGWAVMKWEYDGDLNVRSQMSFDELGRPIERKVYSEGGRMVMRQFRDSENLNPYEEAQMAMFLGGANMKMKNPDE